MLAAIGGYERTYFMSKGTDNEMKQIQQGLEAFLQQELRQMEKGEKQRDVSDPQLYTIGEEKEPEKELDVIGSTDSRKKAPAKKREREDYYIEDWDSPKRQGKAGQSGRQLQASGQRQVRETASGRRHQKNDGFHEEPARSSRKSSTKSAKQEPVKQSKKRSAKKRGSGLKKFLITVILFIALFCGGLYYLVGSVYGKMNFEEIDSVADLPMQEDGVINILLIGNDSRQNGEDGRSDAMILLSISSKTKTIYMTSLLRDMYVEIPGHNGNRLNAAYSYGGAELLMETVEKNLDIPVNRYVLVNFEAFANLVDAVGGVDLELTTGELEYVNGYLVEYNMLTGRPQGTDNVDTTKPGLVHLNGPQALAYCRNRYIGTDFGRTERQRKVLTAVIKKIPAAAGTNYQELIDGLLPNLTTNLTQGECYRLSLMAGRLLTYDIVSDNIPQPDTYKNSTIRQMSVLEVDFDANTKYLKEKIYGIDGE